MCFAFLSADATIGPVLCRLCELLPLRGGVLVLFRDESCCCS